MYTSWNRTDSQSAVFHDLLRILAASFSLVHDLGRAEERNTKPRPRAYICQNKAIVLDEVTIIENLLGWGLTGCSRP